jgi:hypothetical protein
METDKRDELPSNIQSSIRAILERDSNVTTLREEHRAKHSSPIRRTDDGIAIDDSDEQY